MNNRRHLSLVPEPSSRPDLRHPRRSETALYRVRVHLDDSDPVIWRRLELRSDLPLDLLHQVLQVAFDWTDSHLYRFSLGGGGFHRSSQVFVCPYDVDDKECPEDDDALAATDTRLDETLDAPGDVLHYTYDYGDDWELTIRLEEVLPTESGCPTACVVDGERAAPPENCGHLVDVEAAAKILPAMKTWIGKHNRENQCYPLLEFHEGLQSVGLLRKYKGVLLLTNAGAAARADPAKLWDHLASRLIPKPDKVFEQQATLLILLFAATSTDAALPMDTIAELLADLGWGYTDGRPLSEASFRLLPVFDAFAHVTDAPITWARRNVVSAASAALARRALGGA